MNSKKPFILIILDGFGHSNNAFGNAIYNAKTPFLDYLFQNYDHLFLNAAGKYVGLPDNQIGNSEVGHLNIGAGRIVYTGLSLINKAILDHTFDDNKVLLEAISHAQKNHSKIHVMGLLSPGGVHSHQNHIFEMVKIIAQHKLTPIVHAFGDGRDVAPDSIIPFLEELLNVLKKYHGVLGSISGRFYAMDRDKRWERTQLAYDNLTGSSQSFFDDVLAYVKSQYAKKIYDEFLIPARNINHKEAVLSDNDAIIHANFRPDRARQLSHFLIGSKIYDYVNQKPLKNIYYATMMNYEGIFPNGILFPFVPLKNTLGKVFETNNLKQLRIAETEKYAHVNFFFDGGVEIAFKNEQKVLIPSKKHIKTYDLYPKMSAVEITDNLLKIVDQFDVVILNFANADMVGHTGEYKPTIEAIETLDTQLKRIYDHLNQIGGKFMITADHGNAENMIDQNHNKVTKHTTNQVLLISNDKNLKFKKGNQFCLANIAPTVLTYLNIEIPKEMDQMPLIEK